MTKRKFIPMDTTQASKRSDFDPTETNSSGTDSPKRQKTTDPSNSTHKTKRLFETTVKTVKVRNQLKLQQQCFQCSVALYGTPSIDPAEIISSVKNQYSNVVDDDQISKYSTMSLEYLDKESSEGYTLKLLLGDKKEVRDLIGIEGKRRLK